MKKKLVGRLLSLSLSVVLMAASLSETAYAAEIELSGEEEIVIEDDETPREEDSSQNEDTEEFSEPGEIAVEEENTENTVEEASEETSEEAAEDSSEEAAEEAVQDEESFRDEEETSEEAEVASDEASVEETSEESAKAKDTTGDIEVLAGAGESRGTYDLKFNAGIPADCLQKNLYGYNDGQIVPTEIGEPIVLSGDEFELPGYDIVGWTYVDDKGKTVKLSKASVTIKSLTETEGKTFEFTPVWKKGTYTITYDFNGGVSKNKNKFTYTLDSATAAKQPLLNFVKDGDDFSINTKDPEVTRDGYSFAGWDGEYSDVRYYGETVFRNMTLKARWNVNSYTVKFDGNGGTVFGGVSYSMKTTPEERISDWEAVREGYTHKGWKASVKGKDKIFKVSDTISFKDLDRNAAGVYVLTAVWEVNKYSITYDLNDGKLAKAPKSFKTDDGTRIPDPVKPGYKFSGWQVKLYENDLDQGTLVDAQVAGYMRDGCLTSIARNDLTLYANWEVLNYSIVFRNNDGSEITTTDGHDVTDNAFSRLWYTEDVDLEKAARLIEESGALDEDISIAGFAKAKGATKPDYKLNGKNSGILPASYEGEGTDVTVTLYVVPQEKVYRIYYETLNAEVKKATYSYTAKNVAKELAIKAVAVKKGRTFKGWRAAKGYEGLVVTSSEGYVKAIKAGSASDVVLEAEYGDVNTYTVTLMPNAGDVKDANGKLIDSKTGVKFSVGGVDTFEYTEVYRNQLFQGGASWKREGYVFAGFCTDAKCKNYVYAAEGLGSGKNSNVKVYARWMPVSHKIEYTGYASVIRDGKSERVYQSQLRTSFAGKQYVDYAAADITPKALKVTGYTFKGWMVENKLADASGIEYADSSRVYVKKIKKTNKVDIILSPVFEEISYKVYVNPNGGKYDGAAGKTLVAGKVYYTDSLKSIYENIAGKTSKAGYLLECVSITKDSKGDLKRSGSNYGYGYGKKQDASVVLNVIWTKVSPATPTMSKSSILISGDTLSLGSNYWPASGSSRIVFEYSTGADFKTGVQTFAWESVRRDIYGNVIYPSVKITPGRNCYVRARQEVMDSTGKYFPGKWSATVMATKISDELILD